VVVRVLLRYLSGCNYLLVARLLLLASAPLGVWV